MPGKANPFKDRRVLILLAVGLVIVLIIAIAVPLSLRDDDDDDDHTDSKKIARWDCYPEAEGDVSKVNANECRKRKCDFDRNKKPACSKLSRSNSFAYKQTSKSDGTIEGVLTNTENDKDIKWKFRAEHFDGNIMRFYIDSVAGDRYKVPVPLHIKRSKITNTKYDFKIVSEEPLSFQIIRKATGTKVWDLLVDQENGLILSNQLLQISTRLPSKNVYGLGENKHRSFKHQMNQVWPAFGRDQPPGWGENTNLYGVHPFYTCVEDGLGNTHGVLLFNSNAQEYAISDMPSLKFRTFGGILDFYIFMGPTPEEVIQQYTQAIGRTMMPPYWGLGFQLCKYGYNNKSNLVDAVESTKRYGIPHDVQYVDIDHMIKQKIFTVDEERFPKLNDYFHSLQDNGMRIIYLLDPTIIATEEDYEPYEKIKAVKGEVQWQKGVTVPDNVTGPNGAILGYVWPEGNVIFPDFFKKTTQEVWTNLVADYRNNLTFDGIWIDMNEPASFGTNEEKPWNWPENKKPYWTIHCPQNELEDPPVRPKAAYVFDTNERKARISDKTICMSTVQGDSDEYLHYDVHSLYGWSHTVPTRKAVQKATKTRSLVISRSTFPGSGTMAGHWLGDNISTWESLRESIIGMLEFNLFGIPYIGADICGFFNNTTVQLCKRWMQLGAFYPFSRNHNGIDFMNQGPGQLGDEVGNASREILLIRYRLLPYLYTLFHDAHTQGSTVVRPTHHVFPTDKEALLIDRQFFWGSCFLVSPILEEDQTTLRYYLPKGVWYSYHNMNKTEMQKGSWQSKAITSDSMPELHIRGGCILVEQEPANNTFYSQKNPLSLVIALDENNKADGSFFWDDGLAIDSYGTAQYYHASFSVDNATLEMKINHQSSTNPEWQSLTFEQITIMGVTGTITKVTDENEKPSKDIIAFTQTDSNLNITFSSPLANEMRISWH